jgi:hypothetical protein
VKSLFTALVLLVAVACGSPQPTRETPGEDEPAAEPEGKTPEPKPAPPIAPAIDTAVIDAAQLNKPPLVLRFREGWNQHHAFGASGMHLSSEVVMHLHQGNGARVTDSGEHRTSELSRDWGYKEEKKVWDNTWHGTWKAEADSLDLQLAPTEHDCKVHVTDYGDQKSVEDCPKIPPSVRIECEVQRVEVAPTPLSPDEDREPRDVWVCFPAQGPDALGGSPPSWIFADDACIRVSTGFRGKGRSFSLCEDLDQKGAKLDAAQ